MLDRKEEEGEDYLRDICYMVKEVYLRKSPLVAYELVMFLS